MCKLFTYFILLLSITGCKKSSTSDSTDPQDPVTLNCTYPNTFTDPRDSKVYPVIVIGKQTWMAKNLNYEVPGSWCNNCDAYGRMYDWQTAKAVAPAGWHLPTVDEWNELVTTLGGLNVAGGKMKSVTGWKSPNSNATNSSCFAALPGAYRSNDGKLIGVGENTAFWSTIEGNTETGTAYVLGHLYGKIQKTNFSKAWGLSVRCIKD
jgi:uncharacterized protein (TIGR02145 family)